MGEFLGYMICLGIGAVVGGMTAGSEVRKLRKQVDYLTSDLASTRQRLREEMAASIVNATVDEVHETRF